MRPPRPRLRRVPSSVRVVLATTGIVAAFLLPTDGVLAHAELDVPTPANGATVTGTPPIVGATYTETLDPDGSSLILVDASGTEIARGGVATTTEPTKQMSIPSVPELAPGTYTVKSTTKSAADGDIDRKTWSFTVVAAPSPSRAPSGTPASIAPSVAPSATASPVPSPTPASSAATPLPSAGGGSTSGSTSDVILPIVVGLIIVGVVAAALMRRRGGGSSAA